LAQSPPSCENRR